MKTVAVISLLFAAALAAEGPSNCYKTCQGSAKDWVVGDHANDAGEKMVKVVVDMTGCGFSSAPVVHAMLNGDNHNVQTKGGASGIRGLTATGFSLNIFKETDSGWAISPDKAAAANWVLLWSASGYGC